MSGIPLYFSQIGRRPRYPELWDRCDVSWCPSVMGPSGSAIHETSGRGLNFSLNTVDSSTWKVSGEGHAVTFPGSSGYYATTDSNTILSGASRFTISGWFKRTGSGGASVFHKTLNNSSRITLSLNTDGYLYGLVANGAVSFGRLSLAGTSWYHLVMVFDGQQGDPNARVRMYVNGLLTPFTYFNDELPSTAPYISSGFQIGGEPWAGSYYYAGENDDLRVYSRILADSEIKLLATGRTVAYETARPTTSVKSVPIIYDDRLVEIVRFGGAAKVWIDGVQQVHQTGLVGNVGDVTIGSLTPIQIDYDSVVAYTPTSLEDRIPRLTCRGYRSAADVDDNDVVPPGASARATLALGTRSNPMGLLVNRRARSVGGSSQLYDVMTVGGSTQHLNAAPVAVVSPVWDVYRADYGTTPDNDDSLFDAVRVIDYRPPAIGWTDS